MSNLGINCNAQSKSDINKAIIVGFKANILNAFPTVLLVFFCSEKNIGTWPKAPIRYGTHHTCKRALVNTGKITPSDNECTNGSAKNCNDP
nr:hypothetical protein [Mycoplasmopsis bovis]